MKTKVKECECVGIEPATEELERRARAFDMIVEKIAPTLTETVSADIVTRMLKSERTACLTKDEYEFLKTMMGGSK